MPNEMKYDVQFTRAQMEQILADPTVAYIVVTGSCTYLGENGWNNESMAEGYDSGMTKAAAPSTEPGCPRPCP